MKSRYLCQNISTGINSVRLLDIQGMIPASASSGAQPATPERGQEPESVTES